MAKTSTKNNNSFAMIGFEADYVLATIEED
jgi:hypothetical protein